MSVRPKKSLGQHFLTDDGVIHRIVAAVGAPAGARVVEIGPGEGALTGDLLRRYPDLVALEVDEESIAHLRRRFPALDVRHADVLEADWRALAAETATSAPESPPLPPGGGRGEGLSDRPLGSGERPPPGLPPTGGGDLPSAPQSSVPSPRSPRLHVVGNLPYYITSPILFALLDAREVVARAVVMVQREVADRLAAPHGSKTYGTLSVYFALYARAEKLLDVPAACFRPPPAVESAVVAIDFASAEPPDVPFAALQRTVRAAFGQRRKMLRNSLGPLARAAGVDVPEWAATLRPEAVSPADFVLLARHLGAAASRPGP